MSNTIRVIEEVPLYVYGNVQLKYPDGQATIEETRLAICRCGASANKPYRDNSHLKINFRASSEVGSERPASDKHEVRCALKLVPALNGPVRAEGYFEGQNAADKLIYHGSKTSFCLCGGSQNQPFYDYTRGMIEFTGE